MSKIYIITILALVGGLLSGCLSSTQRRAAGIAGTGTGAGAIGYLASDGDPYITGASAAGGAGIAALAMGPDEEVWQDGFRGGYWTGQGDSIKRQFWMQQQVQRWQPTDSNEQQTRVSYYTVPAPPVTVDGMKVDTSNITIPIVDSVR